MKITKKNDCTLVQFTYDDVFKLVLKECRNYGIVPPFGVDWESEIIEHYKKEHEFPEKKA